MIVQGDNSPFFRKIKNITQKWNFTTDAIPHNSYANIVDENYLIEFE